MDVFQSIFDRRSIRNFLEKPVEDTKLLKILDCAKWAPSVGNLQECEFIIVTDPGRKLQLSEAAVGQYWIARASAVIVVLTKNDKILRLYGKKGEDFVKYDAAAAAQNMLLAAHSLGVGACWVSTFEKGAVERILRIPQDVEVHALIPIGYPVSKPNPPHRKNLEFFTFFEEYGKREVVRKKGIF